MHQHYCGTWLDEDDTALGICPECLDFLDSSINSLKNFSLDQLAFYLNVNDEVFEEFNPQEESTIVMEGQPGDVTMDMNPETGTYETKSEFQVV